MEAQCGQLWELKAQGELSHRGPHIFVSFTSRSLTSSHSKYWRKIFFCFQQREKKEAFWSTQCTLFSLTRRAFRRNWLTRPKLLGCYQSLTHLGKGKYPTPANFRHPVPPKERSINCEILEKFTVQRHLTKRLRPNHRTVERFLFPQTLPHY